MPPLRNWFQGRAAIADLLVAAPFKVDWRHRVVRANGQLAVGCYAWNEREGAHVAYAIDVLAIREKRIAQIVSFIGAASFAAHGLSAQFAG